jgi:DNA-binding NtrC family response regulator
VANLENELHQQTAMRKIVGRSEAIRRLKQIIERLAPLEDTVQILNGSTRRRKRL